MKYCPLIEGNTENQLQYYLTLEENAEKNLKHQKKLILSVNPSPRPSTNTIYETNKTFISRHSKMWKIIACALEFSHSLDMTREVPSDTALKEAATNGQHKVLNVAFIDICQKSSTIQAVVKGDHRQSVDLKRDLLLLLSPLLRSLLSSIPPSSSPLLILPGASLPSLLALETLLETGSVDRTVETEEIQNVASILGIPLENIITVYSKARQGSSPAFLTVPKIPTLLDHVLPQPESSPHKVQEPKSESSAHKVKEPKPETSAHKVHEPKSESSAHKVQEAKAYDQTTPAPAVVPLPQVIESQKSEKNGSITRPTGFPCQVGSEKCRKKVLTNTTRLRQHYSMHYIRSLEKSLNTTLDRFMDKCCENFVDKKQDLIVHIGTTHKKIDQIVLEYKGIDLEAMDSQQSKQKEGIKIEKGKNMKEPSKNKCNYELKCEICGKYFPTPTTLHSHVASHFTSELNKRSKELTDGKTCRLCREHFKTEQGLFYHIGNRHGRLNDILIEKGFKVLPCLVNATPSKNGDRIQKQLEKNMVDIKEENLHAEIVDFN